MNITTSSACRWCGKEHGPRCPEIKAIEFHPDGAVKRVEYVTGADCLPRSYYWPGPTVPTSSHHVPSYAGRSGLW